MVKESDIRDVEWPEGRNYQGDPAVGLGPGERASSRYQTGMKNGLLVQVTVIDDNTYVFGLGAHEEIGGITGSLEIMCEGRNLKKVRIRRDDGEYQEVDV